MNRYIYIFKSIWLFLLAIELIVSSCSQERVRISKQLKTEIQIFPDYKEVTIPVNIAPLNFSVPDSGDYCLLIQGKGGEPIQVHSKEGLFDIPLKPWKRLLKENSGEQLEWIVARRVDGAWKAYLPFHTTVAKDSIDPYIAYRLLCLSNDMWNRMGIYQRDLEGYEQSAIYENKLTDYNCVNCHTFPERDPRKFIFHMRGLHSGSVLMDGKKMVKLNTKTPETISNFVYIYWHPEGRYLAVTTCSTYQHFFANNPNTLEVLDHNADIFVYDTEKNELFSCEALSSKDAWQTFPSFSPDGKSLYFSTCAAVDTLEKDFRKMTYSLCRISFDSETRSFGQRVDTLYNGEKAGKSVSFARVSPNGKFLAFTLQEYGGFGVWHKDADLYMLRLADNKLYPLAQANSDFGESYHTWSSNSHWLVFSSRRLDGCYTRPFFAYIDDEGEAHKAFLLPQKNPAKFYRDLFYTYNLPEFLQEEARTDRHAIMHMMRDGQGRQVKYRSSQNLGED